MRPILVAGGIALAWFVPVKIAQSSALEQLATLRHHRAETVTSARPEGNQDSLPQVSPGETAVLVDVQGPGRFVHIWTTAVRDFDCYRTAILRFYWDDCPVPSVEVPYGKFFGQGFGKPPEFSALPVTVSPGSGMNCWWPMPFRRRAVVTLTNEGPNPLRGVFYAFDIQSGVPMSDEEGYFHACYRQAAPSLDSSPFVILEATGTGQFVGTFVAHRSNTPSWWGEGDLFIYVDGSREPSLLYSGTEDYFGGAWGFSDSSYASLYVGHLLTGAGGADYENTSYRFHIPDVVPFSRSIRVALEMGDLGDRNDDRSSVAFWYQKDLPDGSIAYSSLPPPEQQHGTEAYLRHLAESSRWTERIAFLETCATRATDPRFRQQSMWLLGQDLIEQGTPTAGLYWLRGLAPGPLPVEPYSQRIRELLQRNQMPVTDFPWGPVRLMASSLSLREATAEYAGRVGYRMTPGLPFHLDLELHGAPPRSATVELWLCAPGGSANVVCEYRKQTAPDTPPWCACADGKLSVAGSVGWSTVALTLNQPTVDEIGAELFLRAEDALVLLGGAVLHGQ